MLTFKKYLLLLVALLLALWLGMLWCLNLPLLPLQGQAWWQELLSVIGAYKKQLMQETQRMEV